MAHLRNLTKGSIVADNVARADSLWQRLAGLLGRRSIEPDDGLWFDNCYAIHTVGMRSRVDVVFLTKDQRVMHVRYSVPRYSIAVGCLGAQTVVELGEAPEGKRDIAIGDELSLE